MEEKILDDEINTIKSEEEMSYEWLMEFKYIEASLMENMRLYPSVAWESKNAAKDNILLDGIVIKRGDRVTYFTYGMGRKEEILGKDWKEFRWIDDRWWDEGVESVAVTDQIH